MKEFIKNCVPYGLVEFKKRYHQQKKRPIELPQYWDGRNIRNLNPKNTYFKNGNHILLTRDSVSRQGIEILNGEEHEVKVDREGHEIELSFSPMSLENSVMLKHLKISINGKSESKIEGRLTNNKWITVRIKSSNSNDESIKIKCEWQGSGNLFFAEPIFRVNKKQNKPNFIILVLDSLQPQQVTPELTPNILKFFKEGQKFTNSFSQGEWTLPSMTTMMSGLFTIQHGNFNPQENQRPIPEEIVTLPEFLQKDGYYTYINSSGQRFSPTYGHFRGVDNFLLTEWSAKNSCFNIINDGVRAIEANKDSNFFSLLHFYEPHPPFGDYNYYNDSETSPNRIFSPQQCYVSFKKTKDQYYQEKLYEFGDAKLKELDLALSYLFRYLEESPFGKDTYVILTSDHGRTYQKDVPLLVDNLVNTPLFIKGPKVQPGESDSPVQSSLDMYATILDALEQKSPEHVQGRSFLKSDSNKYALSESPYRGIYESSIRSKTHTYTFRCPLIDETGELKTDNVLYEELLDRASNKKIELESEKEILSDFRSFLKDHIENQKRYFTEKTKIQYDWI